MILWALSTHLHPQLPMVKSGDGGAESLPHLQTPHLLNYYCVPGTIFDACLSILFKSY